jgi:inositol 2-dehydrogenase
MSNIQIGVIGLGRMGQVYAAHVAHQIVGVTLVAVADPRPDARSPYESSSVTGYADYHDLLRHPGLHAVIVAAPTHLHQEVVIAAAQAGKQIFCEKPTALSLGATDEMLAAVRHAGVMFQVGFMRRFDEGYADAKRRIDAGEIGDPVSIRAIGRDPFRTSLEFANPAVSGGIIADMGIHEFDLARWYMRDDVERVYSETAALVYPELLDVGDADNAQIVLKFMRGGLGNVEVSRTAIYGYDIQTEIVGSTGTIQVGYLRHTPILLMTKEGVRHDVVPHFPQRFGRAYTSQIEHFADCLKTGSAPMVTPEDARAALQIGLAATRSQREGRVVYVRDVTD